MNTRKPFTLKLLFLTGFMLILSIACQRKSYDTGNLKRNFVKQKTGKFPEVAEGYLEDADIFFVIGSMLKNHPKTKVTEAGEIKEYTAHGWARNASGEKVSVGTFNFGSWTAELNSNNPVDTMFYTGYPDSGLEENFEAGTIDVSYEGNPEEGIAPFAATVDLPVEIEIESPVALNDFQDLYADTVLKWNADPNNSSGKIKVEIRWDGGNYDSPEEFENPVSNIAVVEDNGSTELDSDFFQDISDGAAIRLIITRVTVNLFNTENNQVVKILGISTSQEVFVYRE